MSSLTPTVVYFLPVFPRFSFLVRGLVCTVTGALFGFDLSCWREEALPDPTFPTSGLQPVTQKAGSVAVSAAVAVSSGLPFL